MAIGGLTDDSERSARQQEEVLQLTTSNLLLLKPLSIYLDLL